MSRLLGELVPVGGGDPIPLIRPTMTIGRRDSCDISLKLPAISGLHCELAFKEGYWTVRDMGSTNGIKVNSVRTLLKPLRPGDTLTIAGKEYALQYNLSDQASDALEGQLSQEDDFRGMSLMEKAGLAKPKRRGDDDD